MRQMQRRPMVQVEQEVNVRTSTAVMDSVLSMAIANVCYSRGLFEPGDFESRSMGPGLPLQRRLRDNERTAELRRWLREGVGPALEKRYLDKVLFKISADEAGDQVLEVFSFTLAYLDEADYSDKLRSSKSGIVQQASAMLALLGAYTESTAPLPSVPTYLRIELVYNESTPEDFSPPGTLFTAPRDAGGSPELKFVDKTVVLDLRNVNTPHQSLKTRVFTTAIDEVWQDSAQLVDSSLSIAGSYHTKAAPAGSRSSIRGNSCSLPLGNIASQGSEAGGAAAKEHLLKLYGAAESYCKTQGPGAIVNAALLRAHVPEMKAIDACVILCRLETMQVVSPLDQELGGRKVLEQSLSPGFGTQP